MSRPAPSRTPTAPLPRLKRPKRPLSGNPTSRAPSRRPSLSGALPRTSGINPVTGAPKAQRTSKTTQKLVLLPSAPQTRPLLPDEDEELQHGYETDRGVRDVKSEGERMSKVEREKAGYKRMTAYCVAEGFRMKLLASFLKREHNTQPRVFDEAMYVTYYQPLLPGYGPGINIRSSAPPTTKPDDPMTEAEDLMLAAVSEAEEAAEPSSYFGAPTPPAEYTEMNGFMGTSPPATGAISEPEIETPRIRSPISPSVPAPARRSPQPDPDTFAEVVFFAFGVVVFFGLAEAQERSILEDVETAEIMQKPLLEARWEIEECHYEYKPFIAYPRIYNDFFTFKSHSALRTLSVAHALAQSTLLARYETVTDAILSSPQTTSIPTHLATTGTLPVSRTDALKLTGRLFKLRRDINLVSNVLDVPDLFWEEGQASLRALYDAVRDYMEISVRVGVLNEKLAVAEDLLGAIHDHLNNNAMDRITWIIIWLIVAACLVEVGEVIARLVVHATSSSKKIPIPDVAAVANMTGDEALTFLRQLALSRT
ncbi:uncharacterized protein PHACADRAFT_139625 [Phanerochaete carnosa HHB-10118-sp]|uniref:DUF155 domain-containing protein n=1 Tax=Phanerochaete carnosa (strain HHB-10118-sp) TaxID=650164 RepID=K5X5B3_PHACS|nr:uncharacterized protein PHACADRAFT_139625 [Phanerochaete carnosa HHB-10118-sp]EKM58047.1 hypothetical protein PHACADRAFT_139625 [Phanerochaete carnosa HHB-10118-sp]